MTDLVGRTIGAYQIVERLGRGGMADVYKAYHPDLAQYRAIKIIRQELVTEEGFQERFKREAQAAASLRHPNIVQVHDFGIQDDLYYMVMEFIDGVDLKTVLKDEGALRPFMRIAKLLAPLAKALHYAHGRGLVHRDIKPANVMMTREGQIILTDFGIAKMLDESNHEGLTSTGMAMGTPAYMAPEQIEAQTAGVTADVYSLGIMLYEMLTGRLPFSADTPMAVMLKVMTEPVPAPRLISPDVPDLVQGVVLKATQKDPQRRYNSTLEMITALEQSLGLKAGVPEIVTPDEDDSTAVIPSQSTAETISEAALRAEYKALAAAELAETVPSPAKRPQRLPLYVGGGGLVVVAMMAGLLWLLWPQPSAATWQFIVDASSSMNEELDGQPKIDIARTALADELRILPDNVAASLRVFGGGLSEAEACQDTVQLVAPAAGQGEQLISELARVAPAGEAPLTEAIVQAVGDFDLSSSARQTLIIITDGVDTCEQNAIDQLTTLTRRLGINLDLHLVGLGVTSSEARAELSSLAVAVDGRYYEADSAEEIREVIAQQSDLLAGTPVPTPTEFVAAAPPAGATSVALNTPTQVQFEGAGMVLHYTFEAAAGQTIFFDEQGIEDEGFSIITFVLIAPSGEELIEQRGARVNRGDFGPLLLDESGFYRLEIRLGEDDAPEQMMFTIWVVEPPVLDNGVVPFGQLISGRFETAGQSAVYMFEGQADQTIFFDERGIEDTVQGWSSDFSILRPNGLPLMELIGTPANSADIGPLRLPEDGIYTIVIDPNYENTPSFEFFLWDLQAPVVDEREIGFGEVVTVDFMMPGQTAVYTFEAEAGRPFYFQELDIVDEGSRNWRTDFTVTAPNGLPVAESYGTPANPVRLGDMTAEQAGIYTLTIDPTTDNTPSVSFSIEEGRAGE